MDLVQNLASGIRATVADKHGNPLRKAAVTIEERTYGVSKNMAYFKMILVPGEYTLTVSCEGYDTQILRVLVQRQNVTDIDIKMVRRNDREEQPPLEKLSYVNRALLDLNAKYPRQTTLHTIGQTAKGSEIRCLEIGFNDDEQTGRPAVVFSASVLRSEPVTSGVLLHFASYLLDNYKQNATIARYLNDFSIYVAPDFSPDSNETFTCSPQTYGLQFPVHGRLDDEAAVIANWFKNLNAVLAVNLNSGSRHIEIPFGGDYGETREWRHESADENLLQHLASVYAKARADKSSAGTKCDNLNIGDNDVIHAAMGIGGKRGHPLLDYVYLNTSTLMMDVYVACCTTDHSVAVWQENKASLLACIEEVSNDARGYVINEDDEPIKDAVLSYDKSPHNIKSDKSGFYSILLLPGDHNVTATAPGYHDETKLVSMHSFKTRKFYTLVFKLIRDDNVMGMPRLVFVMMTGEIFWIYL